MRRKSRGGQLVPLIVFLAFAGGMATGWYLHGRPASPAPAAAIEPVPAPTTGRLPVEAPPEPRPAFSTPSRPAPAIEPSSAVELLKSRALRVPVDEADVGAMRGQFGDPRDGGARGHEAVDILAPRNTPVHAVDDGTVAKLFQSRAGGTTIYQFDPSQRFCYYYAHLEGYAPGLHEGQQLTRGQVIGYVGTSGNAPPNTPHLHFAIFVLTPDRHWWEGTAIDPFPAFSR